MTVSDDGVRFIWKEEYAPGVSERLHWPGGASGVTLGAGYDMKTRSKQQVLADLLKAGIHPDVSTKAACGAGLSGEGAETFVLLHRKMLVLNQQQATALLKLILPGYEKVVRQGVHVSLLQQEYDALVSFSYNPGGRFKKVATCINEGRIRDAMAVITSANTSGGKVLAGLVARRKREIELYLRGKYI
ncbi:glycoside hydrolase family protein [Geomonas diazotrophica]|uniref:glycoside hydrolase family protein n=1 Tax=Geomonas diazotrophica TaxID=2843197 RepID=UPI001F3C10F2|nr:glycoside hydrolase family protein [Geomonas diazotrophica]